MVSSTQALRSSYMLFCQLPWLPEASIASGPGGRAFVSALVTTGLSEDRAEEYLRLLRSGAAGPALNWYRAIPFHRAERLPTVTVPTLYLYATADVALGRRAADLTSRYVTGPYRFEALEGASHWIPEEHADVATPILLEHLRAYPV
jgi:pimeloyl-ACP methyl ester carboxylesterase